MIGARIVTANTAVATFIPGVKFYLRGSQLRMCWPWDGITPPRHDFAAILRTDGQWPKYGYAQRPTGGTGFQAIGQLIRYIRDLPRFPMCTWEYWAGDTVKLCTPETLRILAESDYASPEKTKCVLCGTHAMKGLDWWSLDGVVGPCCFGGRCIPEWYALKADEHFGKWHKRYLKERDAAHAR